MAMEKVPEAKKIFYLFFLIFLVLYIENKTIKNP